MATSGENYWPPTGRTSWPLTIHNVVLELKLAREFFSISELDLKTIDVKDYLTGTDVREFFLPDRAVAALELIQA